MQNLLLIANRTEQIFVFYTFGDSKFHFFYLLFFMTSDKLLKPNYLFEISWEVCNMIGGIYTVISTKAPAIKEKLGDQYITIGPDVWKETRKIQLYRR